jgi:hypothetical protein
MKLVAITSAILILTSISAYASPISLNASDTHKSPAFEGFCNCVTLNGNPFEFSMLDGVRDKDHAVYFALGFVDTKPFTVSQTSGSGAVQKPGWKGWNNWVCHCVDDECVMEQSIDDNAPPGWVVYQYDGYCVIPLTQVLNDDPTEWDCHTSTVGGCG